MTAIFISHSSADNTAAVQMKEWLEGLGHTSLFLDFDPEAGIRGGGDWEQTLYQKLRQCQAVIALLTPSWLASKWCFVELAQARAGGKAVFPVKIQDCQAGGVFSDLQHIDLTVRPEEGYRRLEIGLKECGLDPLDVFDWNPNRPPYPGLLAFQEEDVAVFFGRGEEILKALETLETLRRQGRDAARFVLLLGASGSGKSSLARAGVIPRLNKQPAAWLPVPPFRPQEDPLEELAVALSTAFNQHGVPRAWDELRTGLHTAAAQDPVDGRALLSLVRNLTMAAKQPEATVLLTLDQTEELFGYSPPEAATRFLRLLRAALEKPDRRLITLAAMRSDFLGEFQNHPVLLDKDRNYDHHFRYQAVPVDPMPLRNFPEIIQGPARLPGVGLQLEDGLVEAMVRDTGTRDALPLLAFTLRRLYERYGQDGRLEIREYEALGGLEGAIREEANRLLEEAEPSPEQLEALHAAFVPAMVRINAEGGYARRRALLIDMPPRAVPLLRRFVDARLLFTDRDMEGREIIEVAHEALLRTWPQLTTWLAEDQDKLRLLESLQRAAEEWDKGGRRPDLLNHRGDHLQDAKALLANPRFEVDKASVEKAYLDDCSAVQRAREAAEKEEQERRIRDAERIAEEQKRLRLNALAMTIATHALQLAEDHPEQDDLSALLARQAYLFNDKGNGYALDQIDKALRLTLSLPHFGPVLPAPERNVFALAFSPDGHSLATGGKDGTIEVWDLAQFNAVFDLLRSQPVAPRLVFGGHEDGVWRLAFSPDNRILASVSGTGIVKLWDLYRPEAVPLVWDCSGFMAVYKSRKADSGTLYTMGYTCTKQFHTSFPIAFSPDSNTLALGGSDKKVRLWNLRKPEEGPTILGYHPDWIRSLVFSPDGMSLLLASHRGVYKRDLLAGSEPPLLLDLRDWWGFESPEPDAESKYAPLLDFSQNGKMIAECYRQGEVRVWCLSEAKADPIPPFWLKYRSVSGPLSVAFSPDGQALAVGCEDSVEVWDFVHPEAKPVTLRGSGAMNSVAFNPNGQMLASSGHNVVFSPNDGSLKFSSSHSVQLWYMSPSDTCSTVLAQLQVSVRSVAFSPNGRVLVSCSADNQVRVWDLSLPDSKPIVLDCTSFGVSLCFSDFQVYGEPGAVEYHKVFEEIKQKVESGQTDPFSQRMKQYGDYAKHAIRAKVSERRKRPYYMAFSPDSRTLALVVIGADERQRIILWDLQQPDTTPRFLTPRFLTSGHGDATALGPMIFSPNNEALVCVCRDRFSDEWILKWDICQPDSTPVIPYKPLYTENIMTFSSDGRTLAACATHFSGSTTKSGYVSARLWDLQQHDKFQLEPILLGGAEGASVSIALSPDGRKLASGCETGSVALWDCSQLDEPPTILLGYQNKVWSVAFNPDGQVLASGGDDGSIKLWNLRQPSANPVVLTGHEGAVSSVAFSPDGRLLASGSQDGTVRLWVAPTDILAKLVCQKVQRNLTEAEWHRFVGEDLPLDPTCPEVVLPPPPSSLEQVLRTRNKGFKLNLNF